MWFSNFLRLHPHPFVLALRMSRPGFLVITAVGCLIGVASAASAGGGVSGPRAWVTLVLALLAHAAANMLNDHADALNGADAANTQGLFPFTGGSRLVQSGAVQASAMRTLAQVLLALVAAGGLWLALYSGPALVLVGLAGVLLGWTYSMPPLALMSRGLGELAVGLAWGLVVVGADYVQRGHFAPAPLAAAASYALLIANILVANGFPDAVPDAQVGKRTLMVRLGPTRAAWLYLALAVGAHALLAAAVLVRVLPQSALWALAALPLSIAAAVLLLRWSGNPERLRPALVLGIAAAVVHGLALAVGLWWAGR
ncbi:1,4-dihydroxy-2-naphthoate octaprenyltransferase [Simplicispira sp. 125]|nr:1,4-dihydroxy-2-naphthoate octaprenyltransferase [Simplicispira sp. 125]REG17291.1 1,4-dihydroxy-2-naphthoate octaprenyltransferase [Simplicispira sp. 110]